VSLTVVAVREEGVDTCDGQVLAKCCIGDTCADVPVSSGIKPGVYSIEEAMRDERLRTCLEVLNRQRERGIRRLATCRAKESEKCVRRLTEYVLSRYGGPVMLVGLNNKVATTLYSMAYVLVASEEGRPVPLDLVDVSSIRGWMGQVKAVVVAPGALTSAQLLDLVNEAKAHGVPVIMYGTLSVLYKDLGIEYFCPYGIRVK